MKTSVIALLVLVFALENAARADEDAVLKAAVSVGQTSARRLWCGQPYEPFYLTYMQFVRATETLSPEQIALVAGVHGASMEAAAKSLTAAKCSDKEIDEVVAQSEKAVATWCGQASKRAGLKARCDEWRARPKSR